MKTLLALALCLIAVRANACIVVDVTTGINTTYGATNATWAMATCSDGTFYGSWAIYSNDHNIQNNLFQFSNAMALGQTMTADGVVNGWNTVSVTVQR